MESVFTRGQAGDTYLLGFGDIGRQPRLIDAFEPAAKTQMLLARKRDRAEAESRLAHARRELKRLIEVILDAIDQNGLEAYDRRRR